MKLGSISLTMRRVERTVATQCRLTKKKRLSNSRPTKWSQFSSQEKRKRRVERERVVKQKSVYLLYSRLQPPVLQPSHPQSGHIQRRPWTGWGHWGCDHSSV